MSFVYEKFSGTGNDFLIVDIREQAAQFDASLQGLGRAAWARKVCDRHFGLGADGLVLIEKSDSQDFKWDFYNSDGSSAEMCGNAARCVGRWIQIHHPEKQSSKIETLAGVIQIEATDKEEFLILMSPIQNASFGQTLKLENGSEVIFSFINSGVPHVVIQQNSVAPSDANRGLAKILRKHPQFGAAGSNVTFYKKSSESEIEAISFERGVEDFTLACGTGAVAAAFDLYKQTKRGEVRVTVPGGKLRVRFLGASPQLIGPAIKIADCTLSK